MNFRLCQAVANIYNATGFKPSRNLMSGGLVRVRGIAAGLRNIQLKCIEQGSDLE